MSRTSRTVSKWSRGDIFVVLCIVAALSGVAWDGWTYWRTRGEKRELEQRVFLAVHLGRVEEVLEAAALSVREEHPPEPCAARWKSLDVAYAADPLPRVLAIEDSELSERLGTLDTAVREMLSDAPRVMCSDARPASDGQAVASLTTRCDAVLASVRAMQRSLRSGNARISVRLAAGWTQLFWVALLCTATSIAAALLLGRARRELRSRQAAEAALRLMQSELSERVDARTRELSQSNVRLAHEIEERERVSSELLRSNQDLSQFAHIASHDLQEPLRMVTSYLELLERRAGSKLTSDEKEFMAFATSGAARMRDLVQGLLQYSRAGRGGLTLVRVDCDQVVRAALELLRLGIEESKAEVEVGPMPTVAGHAQQLTQLFQNLIGNALKFHGSDRPRVRISAVREDERWHFCVRDNGIGIAPDQQQRVFEIFQRLHATNQFPGTGIGLAIAKRIVEAHGGRIWVESTPNGGSTFHFTLRPI